CHLVITRRRNKREFGAVGEPLYVGKLATGARNMIANSGTMFIGTHFETHDAWRRATQVDDDAVYHRHNGVAGHGILPLTQLGMANCSGDQIHLAHMTLVLLERGDLAGVW